VKKNLIAIDMDGTLLNEKQQISKENIMAIKERAKTDMIYICSGRDFFDIQSILEQNDLQVPVASLNGAFIMNGKEKIFTNLFDRSDILSMFQFLLTIKCRLNLDYFQFNLWDYLNIRKLILL